MSWIARDPPRGRSRTIRFQHPSRPHFTAFWPAPISWKNMPTIIHGLRGSVLES